MIIHSAGSISSLQIDASIIIVNWNTRDLLLQCLKSIENDTQTLSSWNIEVFVVDNASTDGSADAVRRLFSWVELTANEKNVGFARANNQAIRAAHGRYVLLLNSDTVVSPGSIASMIILCDRYREIGVLGPALLNARGDIQHSWAVFPTPWSELIGLHCRKHTPFRSEHDANGVEGAYDVDWMAGACLMVRSETISQVGLLDERFFLYSEETDWCKRIKEAGWFNVYYPIASIVHLEGQSSIQASSRTRFLLHYSKLLYVEKHYGKSYALALRVGFVVFTSTKALLRTLLGQRDRAQTQWRLARQLLRIQGQPT